MKAALTAIALLAQSPAVPILGSPDELPIVDPQCIRFRGPLLTNR